MFSKEALWDILKSFSRLYHLFVGHKEMWAKSQAVVNTYVLQREAPALLIRSDPGCSVFIYRISHCYYLVEGSKLRERETTLSGKRRGRSVKLSCLPSSIGEQTFIFPFKDRYRSVHLFFQSSLWKCSLFC